MIFGTRNPNAADAQHLLSQASGKAKIVSVADSVAKADIVALAVPWAAVAGLLQDIGSALSGKILIDCTNPTKEWPAMDHAAGSGAEYDRLRRYAQPEVPLGIFSLWAENRPRHRFSADAAEQLKRGKTGAES